MRSGRQRFQVLLLVLVAAMLVVWVVTEAQGGPEVEPDAGSGLPVVELADLPPEAAETLALIDAGGPFPEDEDGDVFQNREELLPDHPMGYYKEYTVPTPGSDDRGARRIVDSVHRARARRVNWTHRAAMPADSAAPTGHPIHAVSLRGARAVRRRR